MAVILSYRPFVYTISVPDQAFAGCHEQQSSGHGQMDGARTGILRRLIGAKLKHASERG